MSWTHRNVLGGATCLALIVPGLFACGSAPVAGVEPSGASAPLREAWPDPAPVVSEATEGLTAGAMAFDVDGVAVLLKQTPGNPIVTTSVMFAGGVHDDRPEQAGLERLTLSVLEHGGPADRTKTEYAAALDAMGSRAARVPLARAGGSRDGRERQAHARRCRGARGRPLR